MIYGGLDGIVSVFVSVAAVAGGDVSIGLVIVLGMAKLLSGAISMGVGDWMATAADVDQAVTERGRESWEYDNYVEGEVEEMVQLYVEKGLSEATARRLFEIISPHRKLFIDMMMVDELGILPEEAEQVPWKHGAVNFGSFVAFGIVPLISYIVIVASKSGINSNTIFYITIGVTVATLFMMGIIKSKLTGTNWLKSGVSTILFGSIGAAIGWGVTFVLYIITGQRAD
jgi:DNA damage-binding protein 1